MRRGDQPGVGSPVLWDRVVRLSHWGIAGAVFANEIFSRGGSVVHVWIGWAGLGLLALRLVWGLVGTRPARFSSFPPNPNAALRHVRALFDGRAQRYRSHNPAGALMVYVLWAALAVLIGTGILMSGANPMAVAERDAIVNSNDWSGLVEARDDVAGDQREGDHLVKGVHEAMANLILLLVGIHIAGVAIEGFALRRNLLVPMLFGIGRNGK